MVPKRVVDISPLPSWHLEQRGRLERPAIQATVWREGHQTRLTGPDNKLYHTTIIVDIYTLTFLVSILHSSQLTGSKT